MLFLNILPKRIFSFASCIDDSAILRVHHRVFGLGEGSWGWGFRPALRVTIAMKEPIHACPARPKA